MSSNVTQKLIAAHLREGRKEAGQEIGLAIDQTLTQDATGTMVMPELEAMGLSRVTTELSDHHRLSIGRRGRATTKGNTFPAVHGLADRQVEMALAGSLINSLGSAVKRGSRR